MPRRKLFPDEETYTLSVRIPVSMKDEIEELAVKNRRSMNQEVIYLLKVAFEELEKEQPLKVE